MANEESKLFVAGLPDSISEEVLKQQFEAAGGTVVSVSLPKDRATGRPRGFGFVTLATPSEAQKVRDELDGMMLAGKAISVRPFQAEPPRREPGAVGPPGAVPASPRGPSGPPRGAPQSAPDRTLYVGNLPYDCSVEDVETLINAVAAGSVVRVHLPTDPDGRKRGFGFVTMASAETAKAAADGLRTADMRGRRLIVNLAHPKGERPTRPDGSFAGGGGGSFAGAPFAGSSSAPSPSAGGPPRKPFEEKRRRGTEDGMGPKKRKTEREDRNVRYDDYDEE